MLMKTIYMLIVVFVCVSVLFVSGCITPNYDENGNGKDGDLTMTIDEGKQIASDFIRTSPTFVYGGGQSLTLVDVQELSDVTYQYTYDFECMQGGYGNTSGMEVIQVITPHRAVIVVQKIGSAWKVTSAIYDDKWDALNQTTLG
ncbi:MAG: hypothetical protein ACXQS2_03165 [Methermicoccaceae archaeon]